MPYQRDNPDDFQFMNKQNCMFCIRWPWHYNCTKKTTKTIKIIKCCNRGKTDSRRKRKRREKWIMLIRVLWFLTHILLAYVLQENQSVNCDWFPGERLDQDRQNMLVTTQKYHEITVASLKRIYVQTLNKNIIHIQTYIYIYIKVLNA